MRFLLLSGCIIALFSCNPSGQISHEKANGVLLISIENTPVFGYQFETRYPPQGIDSIYGRSGFIHPLSTVDGKVLTRIQPDDHYHHYGIWNPWTHVLYKGDTIDFWNLNLGEGTVRFSGFESVSEENGRFTFKVLHEHVVTSHQKKEIALNEYQTYELSVLSDSSYQVDMTFEYSCEDPFTILEYRYAGLGWRATEEWNNSNSQVLTSEGNTRKDADGSRATWFILQGELDDKYGGALVLSHPDNFNHPEPLRIWPENMHGGEVFANFAPTKDRDWELLPGNTYALKYRFIVFSGSADAEFGQTAWKAWE